MLSLKHFRARQASKCYAWSTFGEHKPPSATPEALSANQSLQALRLKHFRRPRASRNCASNTFGRTNASTCYSWSTFGDLKPPSATAEALSATQSRKSLRLQHFQPRQRIQMRLLKHFRRPQAARRCACSTFGDPKPPSATPEALSASQSPKKLLLKHFRRLMTSRVGPWKIQNWRPPKKGLLLMSIPHRMDPKARLRGEVRKAGPRLGKISTFCKIGSPIGRVRTRLGKISIFRNIGPPIGKVRTRPRPHAFLEALSRAPSLQVLRLKHFRTAQASRNYA